jgi:hypothetical protein
MLTIILAALAGTLIPWIVFSERDKKAGAKKGIISRGAFAGWFFGTFVLAVIGGGLGSLIDGAGGRAAGVGWAIALIPLAWRRLRDVGAPPWLALLGLLWPVAIFGHLALMFVPGRGHEALAPVSKASLPPPLMGSSFSPPVPVQSTPKPKPTMNLHDYSVSIPEGRSSNDGYVQLEHGTFYSISLDNSGPHPCDAEVSIDGGPVGVWRVDPRSTITLERPVDDTGRFTFYNAGTQEARLAEVTNGPNAGLVTVVFRPGRHVQLGQALYSAPVRGGTGLSGMSHQEFDDAEELEHFDGQEITIHLRLVGVPSGPRPLHKRSTPVPPPVA